MFNFGFSYVGFIYLLMLFIPNLIWTKHQPEEYSEYAAKENKILVFLERTGEALTSCFALIFSDFNINFTSRIWNLWLLASFAAMILYEVYWVRYFKSKQTMKDFYSSLLGIPVAGATLPVIAFFLLGIYGKNPLLIASTIILGIGHIGIHLNHFYDLSKPQK